MNEMGLIKFRTDRFDFRNPIGLILKVPNEFYFYLGKFPLRHSRKFPASCRPLLRITRSVLTPAAKK